MADHWKVYRSIWIIVLKVLMFESLVQVVGKVEHVSYIITGVTLAVGLGYSTDVPLR